MKDPLPGCCLQVEIPRRELPSLGLQEPMLQHSSVLAGGGTQGTHSPSSEGLGRQG